MALATAMFSPSHVTNQLSLVTTSSLCIPFEIPDEHYITTMQEDLEPTVRIRELKKDRVNFVLGNVDLA